MAQDLLLQILELLVFAVPIACIAWTVTHEEVFREPREYCVDKSKNGSKLFIRKFFYLFTCEYCFSHYVTILMLVITDFTLIYDDWRGYFISGFSLVWVANVYMTLYSRIRIDIKKDKTEIELEKKVIEKTIARSNGETAVTDKKQVIISK